MDQEKQENVVTTVHHIMADLETCAQAVETMRPIVSDAVLLQKFNGTFSAHVVTSLQDILCQHALLSLCRMWDQGDDTQSIPRVAKSLRRTKPAKATHLRIEQIMRVVNKMGGSNRLRRMRNWRDKNLGHALKATRREKNSDPIQDPIWGDIFDFESRTSVIVEAIVSAAADIAIDPAEDRRTFSRNARAFWGSFVEKPQ